MSGSPTVIELPPRYPLDAVLAFHARDPLGVAEQVTPASLRKALVLNGEPVVIDIRFRPGFAEYTAAINQSVADIVRHLLALSLDPVPFEQAIRHDPHFGPLVAAQSGLRLPQAATPFEALTWAIIGQQINLPFAIALRRSMIQLAGVPHPATGLVCYPDAPALARLAPEQLTAAKFSRTKAATLLDVAQRIAAGQLALDLTPELPAQLLAIPGIGPWTVNYTLLRGFAHPDCSLHGDVAVRNGLQRLLSRDERVSIPEAETLLARYRPYRSLAAAHLWASLPVKPRPPAAKAID